MSASLFDIAAFWPSKNAVIVAPEIGRLGMSREGVADGYDLSRRKLKAAVMLDATCMSDAWSTWLNREAARWSESIVRATPPWPNAFVLVRGMKFSGVAIDIGVHCVSYDTAQWAEAGFPDPVPPGVVRVTCDTWAKVASEQRVKYDPPTMFVDLDLEGKFVAFGAIGTTADQSAVFASSPTFTLPWFAFQLLHCRNVSSQPHARPAIMPRGKKNHPPKIEFHTLSVGPITGVESSDTAGPGEVAKHVCRGSFAHYTEAKKLFGKFVGMFWRPMHIRGSAKHGIVGKDYRLDPEDE